MSLREKKLMFEKPVLTDAKFIDFEIEKEEWNDYRLADGSMLKARFVLTGTLMEKTIDEIRKELKTLAPDQDAKIGFGIRSQRLFSVESPSKLRGTPDPKKYSFEELRDFIVEEDIDFETVKATWNSYLLENGMRVKCRLSPTTVSKTSKFDDAGMPIYIVDATLEVKITMPEDIERIFEQRKKTSERKLEAQRTKAK